MAQLRRITPDLLITDLSIPVMDGRSIVLAIKKIAPKIPIIIISGKKGMQNDPELRLATQIHYFLAKPVGPSLLLKTVQQIFACKKALQANRPENQAPSAEANLPPLQQIAASEPHLPTLQQETQPHLPPIPKAPAQFHLPPIQPLTSQSQVSTSRLSLPFPRAKPQNQPSINLGKTGYITYWTLSHPPDAGYGRKRRLLGIHQKQNFAYIFVAGGNLLHCITKEYILLEVARKWVNRAIGLPSKSCISEKLLPKKLEF